MILVTKLYFHDGGGILLPSLLHGKTGRIKGSHGGFQPLQAASKTQFKQRLRISHCTVYPCKRVAATRGVDKRDAHSQVGWDPGAGAGRQGGGCERRKQKEEEKKGCRGCRGSHCCRCYFCCQVIKYRVLSIKNPESCIQNQVFRSPRPNVPETDKEAS